MTVIERRKTTLGERIFSFTFVNKLDEKSYILNVIKNEKLSFKLMNIICVIQGTSQTGSKNNFPFPIDYCSYFFHARVPWSPPEGS